VQEPFAGPRIAAVAVLVMTAAFGLNFAAGVFFAPLTTQYGRDVATLSAAAALNALVTGLLQPAVGALADRVGPRVVLSASLGLLVSCYLLLAGEATRWQYTHGVPAERLDRLTPDTWTLDQALLDRPGNQEVQRPVVWDYQFNLDSYPAVQDYFRTAQPPTLVAWGEHDEIFGADGARAFAKDLPDAEIHLLDAGHFALETHGDEIAALIRTFLSRTQG